MSEDSPTILSCAGPKDQINEVIKNINGGKAKGISLIGIKKGDIKKEVHQK